MTASRPRNTHERNLERQLGEIANPLPRRPDLPLGAQESDVAGRLAREAVLREASRRAHLRVPGGDPH